MKNFAQCTPAPTFCRLEMPDMRQFREFSPHKRMGIIHKAVATVLCPVTDDERIKSEERKRIKATTIFPDGCMSCAPY